MFARNSVVINLLTRRLISSLSMKSLILNFKNDSNEHLLNALRIFSSNKWKLTYISSQPITTLDQSKGDSFVVSIESSDFSNYNKALGQLQSLGINAEEKSSIVVPWFPRTLSDLDGLDQTTLTAGVELECDHPGFKDIEYRKRREDISRIAFEHNCLDSEVPRVKYTKQEIETWNAIYNVLTPLHTIHACKEYNSSFAEMHKYCGYRLNNIPQLQDTNDYLATRTGFRLIPIAGLLSARDFLNYLAFRIFASTQYIRHHSVPFYTPEPDIVHELMGHAPLFANTDFADFSQQIGLASLGVSDHDIKKLATCYWFSVEFGVIFEDNGVKKGYGAGVLSSVDELINATSDKPEFKFFNPFDVCDIPYPITTLQPTYMWSKNFEDAKKMMTKYAAAVPRGFDVAYDKDKQEIKVYQDISSTK